MTPRQFWQQSTEQERERVAERAGTTVSNLKQIAYGGAVSRALAKELERASGRMMTRDEILFPEDYEDTAA